MAPFEELHHDAELATSMFFLIETIVVFVIGGTFAKEYVKKLYKRRFLFLRVQGIESVRYLQEY